MRRTRLHNEHDIAKGRAISSAERLWWMRTSRDQVCAKCQSRDRKQLTVDHIVPLGKGGPDIPENWQWLCRKCNEKKADRSVPSKVKELREKGLMS